MKKSLLKVLASMLVLAMAITTVVIPNVTAKAADETELVIVLPDDETRVAKVLLDFDWNGAGLVAHGTADSSVGWGRDMYTFTKDASANIYRISLTGTVDAVNNSSLGATIQFLFIDSTGSMIEAVKFPLWDTKADNVNAYKNNNALYFTVTVSGSASWAEVTPSTQDPTAASAADVMAVIDEIGTVELSDTCKGKIEAAKAAYSTYTGNASDITNASKLTDAEAEWNRLLAAGAGKITLYVKNNAGWDKVALYGYDGADLGNWGGTLLTADENNEGWLTITTTLTQAASLIFNNNGAGKQSPDWKYATAGTYWVTIAEDNTYTTSKTAPTGWSTGEAGTNPGEGSSPEGGISQKGDVNMMFVTMILLAGAALVTVGVASKKKFA